MKRFSMTALLTHFLKVPSIGFNWQGQDNQHKDTGLKQYKERLKRSDDGKGKKIRMLKEYR